MVRLAFALVMVLITTTATAADGQKWEYCALSRSLIIGAGLDDLKLRLPRENVIESNSFEGLAGQLRIEVNGVPNSITILNYLGEQGWELVSHSEVTYGQLNQIRLTQTWTFKRPKASP